MCASNSDRWRAAREAWSSNDEGGGGALSGAGASATDGGYSAAW